MDDYEGPQRSHVFHTKPGEEAMRLNTGKKKCIQQEEGEKSTEPLVLSSVLAHLY